MIEEGDSLIDPSKQAGVEPSRAEQNSEAHLGNANAPHHELQVSRIKERVEEKEGIPPVQQRLIYGGKQMWALPRLHLFPVPLSLRKVRCCIADLAIQTKEMA